MSPDELIQIAEAERQAGAQYAHDLGVCQAAGCLSLHSAALLACINAEVERAGLGSQCRVRGVGCLGLCSHGPLLRLDHQIVGGAAAEDVPALVGAVARGESLPGALQPGTPFFARQQRIALENAGQVDPERLEDYLARYGYAALARAVGAMEPREVREEVVRSGLRGRGGAGYPTGLKWHTVAKSGDGRHRYVVCNADEGDPGAFMDRSILESDPHRVLEGMAIAGYAVGAERGYIYVRAEYPLAVRRLRTAIRQAEARGILGAGLFDSPFNFDIEIRIGAGAFVCGEETALIHSIEGGRGTPRPRPPYPAEHGLWGRPTLINNVETFACVPAILRRGGEWFAGIGTDRSKGTKVFALAGQVRNNGVVEVPMGITLREIVFEIGGGIPNGRRFKAVQTGGASGGCLPESCLDLPVDYDSLVHAGSIMGSGGMVVMDDSTCMVDVARYFMEFCMEESCGKCVPCRVGTVHLHHLLQKMTRGEATVADLEQLESLSDVVKHTSLCGLGQSAPNPVQSTLRYFREEYLAHIRERRCPAGVCSMNGDAAA